LLEKIIGRDGDSLYILNANSNYINREIRQALGISDPTLAEATMSIKEYEKLIGYTIDFEFKV